MNNVSLIGRAVRDPEIRSTASGKMVATVTIAVDRNFKNQSGEREADFIPLVIWGNVANVVEKYVTKGKQIGVTGRIQTRTYDAPDGSKRYITEVVVNDLQLLGSKNEQAQPTQEPQLEEVDNSDELPF